MKSHYTSSVQFTLMDSSFIIALPTSSVKEPSSPLFSRLAYDFDVTCLSLITILCYLFFGKITACLSLKVNNSMAQSN